MKIKVSLSRSSIENAIKQLENYKADLNEKCREFTRRLIDKGINVAMFSLHHGIGDSSKDVEFGVNVDGNGNLVRGMMTLKGKDVLFWEFGAGNYFNGMKTPNPKAEKFGMGIGTYPGQTHVPDPGYWWYVKDGQKHFSRGTKAAMPMFNASIEMINEVYHTAQEVFNGQ